MASLRKSPMLAGYHHSNHSDMDRLDGAGAYWNSRDRMADGKSAAASIPYPISGPRPANTDTIRPWQGPVALVPEKSRRGASPEFMDAPSLFRGEAWDREEAANVRHLRTTIWRIHGSESSIVFIKGFG